MIVCDECENIHTQKAQGIAFLMYRNIGISIKMWVMPSRNRVSTGREVPLPEEQRGSEEEPVL